MYWVVIQDYIASLFRCVSFIAGFSRDFCRQRAHVPVSRPLPAYASMCSHPWQHHDASPAGGALADADTRGDGADFLFRSLLDECVRYTSTSFIDRHSRCASGMACGEGTKAESRIRGRDECRSSGQEGQSVSEQTIPTLSVLHRRCVLYCGRVHVLLRINCM